MDYTPGDLMRLASGNPGAFQCLLALQDASIDLDKKDNTVKFLKDMDIKGTDIYVLWSDICGRSVFTMVELIEKVPALVVKDASSRQDYSGRNLPEILEFFKNK